MDTPAASPKSPLRVAILANAADRSELALFAALASDPGIRLTLAVSPKALRLEAIRQAVPGAVTLAVRSRLDPVAIARFRRLLRETGAEVVYAPTNRTLATALIASTGLPCAVIGYRGTIGHVHRRDPASWLTYLHPRLAHVVCVSDAVLRHLRDEVRLPAGKLTRIYKGHDPAWYDAMPVSGMDLGEFGVPAGAALIGFAGNTRPVKGVDVLVAALQHLPPHVHLLVIGEVRDRRTAAAIARPPRPWHAHVTGWRPDAVALMRRCDVLAMPSVEREGLPRAVVEAMAIGKPVVVTAVGGMPELVEHGVTGRVVPPRDPAALGHALASILEDPALAAKMGAAGRRRVEELFHIRHTVAAFRALLLDVAAR